MVRKRYPRRGMRDHIDSELRCLRQNRLKKLPAKPVIRLHKIVPLIMKRPHPRTRLRHIRQLPVTPVDHLLPREFRPRCVDPRRQILPPERLLLHSQMHRHPPHIPNRRHPIRQVQSQLVPIPKMHMHIDEAGHEVPAFRIHPSKIALPIPELIHFLEPTHFVKIIHTIEFIQCPLLHNPPNHPVLQIHRHPAQHRIRRHRNKLHIRQQNCPLRKCWQSVLRLQILRPLLIHPKNPRERKYQHAKRY